MAETRQFQMHARLLYDVIMRQAGSLAKAVLEGVMNAVDAGSSACHITVTANDVDIQDDGKGFKDKDEVARFFEVFGQPHDASENKYYGTFRMGRGQLFAYGRNKWRTKKFSMDVDIKNNGLSYELVDDLEDVEGCQVTVTLYDQLYPSELVDLEADIKRWCRWIPIPVYYNGTKVSNPDPNAFDWMEVTDDAYIEIDERQTLDVFNLGAFVTSFPKYRFGIGGEVVTRKQLRVNFARNDIQSDCPVWAAIRPVVERHAGKKLKNSKSLDDAGRQRLATQMKQGKLTWEEFEKFPLFTLVTGRHVRASNFMYSTRISVCDKGNRLGDNIHRQKLAIVLAKETIQRFGFLTGQQLLDWLKTKCTWGFQNTREIAFEEISKGMQLKYEIIPDNKHHPLEKVWLDLISTACSSVTLPKEDDSYRRDVVRKILLGLSDQSGAWTDAGTYIALNRKFLSKHSLDLRGFAAVGAIILHEYCHCSPDLDDHDHDQGFYELFHDSSGVFLSEFIHRCSAHLPQVLQKHNKKLTRRQLQDADNVALASRRQKEFDSMVKG